MRVSNRPSCPAESRPDSLLPWLDSVLLRRNEVKEGFSSRVQLVQLALWGWLLLLLGVFTTSVEGPFWLGFLLPKDGEQEGAMVERAILERVIQFADLRKPQGNLQLDIYTPCMGPVTPAGTLL